MKLSILDATYSICRLASNENMPNWIDKNNFWNVTQTSDELSIVCTDQSVPKGIKVNSGWKIIKVEGTLDFCLTGILSSLAKPLAEAKISIFAVSTFDTDYILVKEGDILKAKNCLIEAGFTF